MDMLTRYSDDEDEAAELMRELEKIKRERLEQKEKEVRPFLSVSPYRLLPILGTRTCCKGRGATRV
jgi:hypothetical protein